MIEKNIRLQPHHARDLLVGRRSDGRRPGYQPPGHGPGESRNGRSGPPGGGGGHHSPPSRPAPAPSRPAPAPAPAPSPSPHRDPAPAPTPNRVSPQQSMAMTGNTSLAGQTQSQAQASVDRDNASRNIHVDTPKIKAEQDKLDLQKMIADQQEEKYGPTADPTKFGETISPLDVAMSKPELERTIDDKLAIEEWENEQDWDKVQDLADKGHSSDDIQKAMDKGLLTKASVIEQQGARGLIERGLAAVMPKTKLESSLLSNLKSKLDPKSIAGGMLKSAAIKKLGLGWLNPILGIASLLGFDPIKKAQAAFAKKPKDLSAFSNLGLYADRQPTDKTYQARVGEGTIGSDIALGKKGVFESGQELLGLKDIEGQQAKNIKGALIQQRNFERKSKAPDIYGALTPLEEKMYQKSLERDKEEKIYTMPVLRVAEGGRIDKPLIGRNRYI